uniref:G-protein coupled receptor,putative n=1 Tax=Schistosoma mansoni TaxID=6183 RepID=A0A3Q0KMA7_SCHMA
MLFTKQRLNTFNIIDSLYQNSNNNNNSTTTNINNNSNNSNNISIHTDPSYYNINNTINNNSNSISIHTDPLYYNEYYYGYNNSNNNNNITIKIIIFIKIIIYILIIISALFGNALIFIAYIKFKQLRLINTNLFIISLALADFIVALLVMPLNAIMSLLNYQWLFGHLLCNLYNATDVLFSTSSILHLCCISMDRYIAIIYPLHYNNKMSKRHILILIGIIWTLSLLISYIPILMGLHKPFHQSDYITRIQGNTSKRIPMKPIIDNDNSLICDFNVNPYYAIISSSISFWIPSIIMIIIYIRIFIEAKRQEKKIAQLYIPYRQVNNTTVIQQISSTNHHHNNDLNHVHLNDPSIDSTIHEQYHTQIKLHHENKAARTLGIVMSAFLLCWLPFFLWYTISNLCSYCTYPNELKELLYWIGYFNSSINPIIYTFYNRTFRQAFIKIIILHNHTTNNNTTNNNHNHNEEIQQSYMDSNRGLPISRRYNPVNELITRSIKRRNHENFRNHISLIENKSELNDVSVICTTDIDRDK